ncbi:MAG: transporter ATP-binding protein [Rhodospirillales bacterium]|nr:transporter ATP-binding protein [Rhodospirillales bacterium]
MVLIVRDLVAGYGAADEILKGVSLSVGAGEIVSIIGPNGAGKSTCLKVIAGLLAPRRGSVTFKGHEIAGLPARRTAALGLAYVAQENNVFPSLSIQENLAIGGYLNPSTRRRRSDEIMGQFPLLRERRRDAARALSGGQRQTLAVAMALMSEPALLVLDEPSAGLSPVAAETLFETIVAIKAAGVSVLMIEQNALDALAISDRAYILVLGQNRQDGPAADLANDPEIRTIFLGG